MSYHQKCMEDVRRFFATGELPEPWDPEKEDEGVVDSWVAEINAELEAIESGCVEPPPGGWLCEIGRKR